ncbi:hypothetical protein CLOP_g14454 [Closterium sp. NIES-67]|nr:hypothetical protein CLOP_g22485 [Closterium sp. NIES-67]GJP69364.1 hypothetical protein CLOP_g299 [Closterium sp. NIES-67]GJP76249.1 hypothetical protein CLOP_g6619 [Closterium sp. NIES-67]GJP82288.1 hypothetical protein CLOP_g12523 [Closterium sp. NIES-67]GJP84396.1 hypothetical protein CLOP_g14454 [Closterium sp. NIES-67]
MAAGAARVALQAPLTAQLPPLLSPSSAQTLPNVTCIRLPHRTGYRHQRCIPARQGLPSLGQSNPVRYSSVRCSLQTERKRHESDRLWSAPNGVKHSKSPHGGPDLEENHPSFPLDAVLEAHQNATPHRLHSDSSRQEADANSSPESSLTLVPHSHPADVAIEKPSDVAADVEPESNGELLSNEAAVGGSLAAGALIISVVASLALLGYMYKDELSGAIDFFTTYIEGAGSAGYVVFVMGYALLEVLAVPAIPLTLSAGVIFGPVMGTFLCSLSGTISATIAFLIARYVARDRILGMVRGNKKYEAIDRAVGDNSFRIVTLLRLSPLMPFSLGNYFYGLTSVKLLPYVAGTWIGMLPGTWAYVSAGAFGRSLLEAENGSSLLGDSSLYSLLGGVALTAFAATYITKIVQDAVKEAE